MQGRLRWLVLGCLAVQAAAIGCSKEEPVENGFQSGPVRGDDDQGDDDDDDQPGPTSGLPKPSPNSSSSGGKTDAGSLGTSSGCIEIEPDVLTYSVLEEGLAIYNSRIDAAGHAGLMDLLFVTDEAREEDLATGLSANYRTCEYCVRVEIEDSGRTFFQQSGMLTIDPASDIYTGTLDATLTDVKLIEVTYDDDLNSIPVANGVCLHVESASLSVTP